MSELVFLLTGLSCGLVGGTREVQNSSESGTPASGIQASIPGGTVGGMRM